MIVTFLYVNLLLKERHTLQTTRSEICILAVVRDDGQTNTAREHHFTGNFFLEVMIII